MNAQISDNFMAHLIDKDAVLAEIRRLHSAHSGKYGCDEVGMNLEHLEDFLDTLEVKEVDISTFSIEVYKYIGEHFNVYDDGNQTLQTKDSHTLLGRIDAEKIAKHFFELGLKAQQG